MSFSCFCTGHFPPNQVHICLWQRELLFCVTFTFILRRNIFVSFSLSLCQEKETEAVTFAQPPSWKIVTKTEIRNTETKRDEISESACVKKIEECKTWQKKQSVKFAQKQIWCWLCPRALPSPPWGGFFAAVRTPRLLRGGDFHQVKTSRHFSIEDFYSFSHWVSSQEIWKVPATRWREWWSHRSRNGWVASKVFWEFFGQVSGLVRKSN